MVRLVQLERLSVVGDGSGETESKRSSRDRVPSGHPLGTRSLAGLSALAVLSRTSRRDQLADPRVGLIADLRHDQEVITPVAGRGLPFVAISVRPFERGRVERTFRAFVFPDRGLD